jgi:hypothetical protein
MTSIGPPHLGQSQASLEPAVDTSALASGAEQLKAKWQGGGTSAIGQEAEVTDAHETLGQQMQQEAAQELIDS